MASSTRPALASVIAKSGLDATRIEFVKAMSSTLVAGDVCSCDEGDLPFHRLALESIS
jgi:hypothetical protein